MLFFSSPLLAGVLVFLGPFTVFLSSAPEKENERETDGEKVIGKDGVTRRETEMWREVSGKREKMKRGVAFFTSLFIKCLNECAFKTSWGIK